MEFLKIPFEVETPYGPYRDTLYFIEGEIPSDEEIEQIKLDRVDNWIAVITAPIMEMPGQVIEEPIAGNGSDG